MDAMFNGAIALSDCNKRQIHDSFSASPAWVAGGYPSVWSALCLAPTSASPTAPTYSAVTESNKAAAVALWFSDETDATSTYGHIRVWDVTQVTDMSTMFCADSSVCGTPPPAPTTFNEDLDGWDTSSVTRMYRMLRKASAFNQPCGWDTSGVTNMQGDRLV